MCGIFGIINKDSTPVSDALVYSATQKLTHRGPDDEGFYVSGNIGLGHKRLSIIDLSKNGGQPFHKHEKVLIYNGEIYNFEELRAELLTKDYQFHTETDTELIISAYDYWGTGMFEKFNGMWAIALWDQVKEELLLSRDRFGMKPLYIYNKGNQFSIASEIKAFSQLQNWTGELDISNVNDFLVKGKLHHNSGTLYKDVSMLAPSTWAKYNKKGELVKKEVYYSFPSQELLNKNETKTYKERFSKAIEAHFVSDVEVACALSGGLDSSSIVAESYTQNHKVKTFSYAPQEEEFSEYQYVQKFQKDLGFETHCISPSFDEHLAAHREALWANEAPALSINLISSFLLYQSVGEQDIKVLLAGQGADELLLGYSYYYGAYLKHLRKTSLLLFLKEVFALIIKYPKQVVKVLKRNFEASNYGQFLMSNQNSKPQVFNGFTAFYEHHLRYGQLHPLLQFEDRLSMAHSVEGRLPFLDRDFSEFLCAIPHHKKIVGAIRKMPLRKAMQGLVPDEILNRKDKMGYLSPQEHWVFEKEDFFLNAIQSSMKKHPGWLKTEALDFIHKALKHKKHHSFIWRAYSFYEFLEVKL